LLACLHAVVACFELMPSAPAAELVLRQTHVVDD
jgi:hypothetical protein